MRGAGTGGVGGRNNQSDTLSEDVKKMEKEKRAKWVRENKKKIGIGLGIVIAACGGVGIYSVKGAEQTAVVREEAETKAEIKDKTEDKLKAKSEDKSMAEEETKTEKKAAAPAKQETNTKKDNDRKTVIQSKENGEPYSASQEETEILGAVNETNQQSNNSSSDIPSSNDTKEAANDSAGNGVGDTDSSNSTASRPEEKEPEEVHEPKWVVDQNAWTETISEPIYDYREYSVCNTCGGDITGYETAHIKEHMLNGENGSWRSEWADFQVGTNTFEVSHEEVGHWE